MEKMTSLLRLRMSAKDAHYGGNLAPVYAGDYIEAYGEIEKIGNTSRTMKFEARKVIVSRPDISASAADVLAEPVVVCRAHGTCVTPKDCQRLPIEK